MLRKIFGPQKEEERGGWRKVHTEGLQDLYSIPKIIRVIK
jgi:hypothetical protein